MYAKDPLKAVTVRDLARNTAAILDELGSDGRPMVITRGGIPVASLQPLDTQPWRPLPVHDPLASVEAEPIDLEDLALNARQHDVIMQLDRRSSPDEIALATKVRAREVMIELSSLELEGLVSAQWGAYELTLKGKRVRDALERAAEG